MKDANRKTYITLKDGIDYRTISKIMSKAGYQMNHATARNTLMNAMNNFVVKIGEEVGLEITQEKANEILKESELHHAFSDILFKAYSELKKDSLI